MKVSEVLQTMKRDWVAVQVDDGTKVIDTYGFPGNRPALWHITENRAKYPEYADKKVYMISVESGPYGHFILIRAR